MDKWHKKHVFISGGAGVIGTPLVNSLIDKGAIIFIGDLKPQPHAWQGRVTYRQGDLITLSAPEIADFSPEVFFHLAATFERSEETYEFWEENFHHNVHLSHHLLGVLKDLPSLKTVIFASSYLIYDPSLYLFSKPQSSPTALDETCAVAPRNLCGNAKWTHEQELQFIRKFKPHLQTICARIFRSYGKNSRDIISRWIRMLLKGETISVYRPEGIFDYIYADDVAEGLLQLAATRYSGTVNLGSGHGRKVSDMLQILQQHFGPISTKIEEIDIPYEASQANMQRFITQTHWNGFRQLEETIPLLIAFEKAKEQRR